MDNDAFVLKILATVGIGLLAVVFLLYLLDAISRFRFLKVRNYQGAWIAFIPIANVYGTVEAVYGNRDTIKVYGTELPAILVKLFPLVASAVTAVASIIPGNAGKLGSLIWLVQVALFAMIYRDMMFRLRKEVSQGFAVAATLIPIIGSIYLIASCSGLESGEYDYQSAEEELQSQM